MRHPKYAISDHQISRRRGDTGQAAGIGATAAPADRLLSRLEAVRTTGPGRWTACCPAHDDQHPSLSVRETEDGAVLVKCFAGCGAADIVSAVGLELRELFPARPQKHHRGPVRKGQRWIPRDVLTCVAEEALLVGIAAEHVAAGNALESADLERLRTAAARLKAAAWEVRYD